MSMKRFRVALSYAGEKRAYVSTVARILADHFTKDQVLYDEFREAEFARPRLNQYLPRLYNEESDLVVVIICRDYQNKEWCGLEWDAIFDLIQKWQEGTVMLANFDQTKLSSLYNGAGYVALDDKTPEEFAVRILERLAINEKKPHDHHTGKIPPASQSANTGPAASTYSSAIIRQTFSCQFRRFYGRSEQLKNLLTDIEDEKRTGVIIGAVGGMGKTALAYQFCTAHKIEEHFDLVLGASSKETYLDVDAQSPEDGLRQTGRTMHTVQSYRNEVARQLQVREPGARPDGEVEKDICSAVDGRRTLFLLDNLETLAETTATLDLLYRLCVSPQQKFLVTARSIPNGLPSHVAAIPLHKLEEDDAKAIVDDLFEELRRSSPDHHPFTNGAVRRIVDRGCGHPLALRLLTAKVFREGEDAIFSTPDAPKGEDGNEWIKRLFDYVFEPSFLKRHVGLHAVNLACMVAAYPGGIRERTLVRAFQAVNPAFTKEDFAKALQRLFGVFCVQYAQSQPGTETLLTMHPLVREFFAGLEGGTDEVYLE